MAELTNEELISNMHTEVERALATETVTTSLIKASTQTSNFTVPTVDSYRIPVDSTSSPITVTLNDSAEEDTRILVYDANNSCGTNSVIIESGAQVEITKLSSNQASVEIVKDNGSWAIVSRYENLFDRDDATTTVTLNKTGDTFAAGSFTATDGEFGQAGTTSNRTVANSDFTNIGADITQNPNYLENTYIGSPPKFNEGNPSTDNSTPYTLLYTGGERVGNEAWKALDSSTTTFWRTNSGYGDWILDLGAGNAQTFGKVELQSASGGTINAWSIEGSNDNVSYDVLLTETTAIVNNATSGLLDFSTTGSYRYYKVKVTSTNLGFSFIANLDLYPVYDTTFDTNLATASSGTFGPGTFKAYDENNTLISGSSKVNVAYSVDGGAFSSLEDQTSFQALGNIAYTTQFDLRLQAVGSQRISRATISTPDQKFEVGADGTVTYKANDIKYAKVSPDGVELPSLTTAQRDAISTPVAGLMIFNSTTSKLNFYTGSAWEAVTSA